MLKVKNHKEFCFFEYESETSPTYQLGDVLTKDYSKLYGDSEMEPEVGVVIQTFEDGDFRTDMWGMSSESEVSPSTILEIKKYRPNLMESLLIS